MVEDATKQEEKAGDAAPADESSPAATNGTEAT